MSTRSVSATVLRTVFAIVFSVTGFLLGRELYVNVLSLHFASDWLQWTMMILSPVVGALVGIAVAPLAQAFFEDELDLVERAIERLAPAEIAGGAVGLLVGLGTALLVKSICWRFISITGRAGSYLAILLYLIVTIFFAYLGARVGPKTRLLPLVAKDGNPHRSGGCQDRQYLDLMTSTNTCVEISCRRRFWKDFALDRAAFCAPRAAGNCRF